jgi:hypothetical protein
MPLSCGWNDMNAASTSYEESDGDQIVAAFAARLQGTVDLGSVRDDLAAVADQALQPVHVFVWTNERR